MPTRFLATDTNDSDTLPASKNLVLGLCTGYTFDKIEAFIASLFSLGSNIDLCLFSRDMDAVFDKAVTRFGIRVCDPSPYLDTDVHPMISRFTMYRDFLDKHGDRYSQVLLTDIRDVLFQTDPFATTRERPVYFAAEDIRLGTNDVNAMWVREVAGDAVVQAIADQPVSCAGTTIGTVVGIRAYLDEMCRLFDVMTFDKRRNYDQGVHNVLASKIRPEWGMLDADDRVINTVGCTSADRITIVDDTVLVDGRIPPVIHQWDRHHSIVALTQSATRFRVQPPLLTDVPLEPPVGPRVSVLVSQNKVVQAFRLSSIEPQLRSEFFYADLNRLGDAIYGPHFIEPAFRTYRSPEIFCARLQDALLIGTDGIVLHEGSAIEDTIAHISFWHPTSAVASFEVRQSVRFKAPLNVSRELNGRPYLVGFTAAWGNYAHWMQQCLPILVAFLDLRKDLPDLRIVLPRFPPDSFQQQTLDLLGIEPDAVEPIAPHEVLKLSDGMIIPPLDIWNVSPLNAIAAARLASSVPDAPSSNERVYLHRTVNARRVANFREVRQLVEHYGFRVVSFEDATLTEQIQTMRKVRNFIGEHGAGLANVLFCPSGGRLLELFNPVTAQPAFWSVAGAANVQHGFVVGTHVPTEYRQHPDWNSAYDVPLDRLEDAIRTMLDMPAIDRTAFPGFRAPTIPQVAGNEPLVRFTAPGLFQIGAIPFALHRVPAEQAAGRVRVLKEESTLNNFLRTLGGAAPRRIFEIGVHQGGNACLLCAFFPEARYAGIDASKDVDAVEALLDAHSLSLRAKVFNDTPQTDPDRIRRIIREQFGDEVDVIVDNASHGYEMSKTSFEISFPFLVAGGKYVIESWAWSHWPESQNESSGWNKVPALSNLILELVLLLPSSDLIESIEIRDGFVVITKKGGPRRKTQINIEGSLRLRGRTLGKI
ncbi:MAG: glycosyltransferase 61 family protein [Alphaproteobacteria bacterium]|nr:glycosyltransferase 61 family protein [Alphaproteobacteria bacterium]